MNILNIEAVWKIPKFDVFLSITGTIIQEGEEEKIGNSEAPISSGQHTVEEKVNQSFILGTVPTVPTYRYRTVPKPTW